MMAAALVLGLRHGIDWDHIAAITDIAAAQESPGRAIRLGTLYALGHAVVVLVLGIVAVLIGDRLPSGVDEFMGPLVGISLVALGLYVLYALIRYRRDFRLRSRWMLLLGGLRRAWWWVRERFSGTEEVHHAHPHPAMVHHDGTMEDSLHGEPAHLSWPVHHHHHRHEPGRNPFFEYGSMSSAGVGMLHGIGAETPTQLLIFLAAAGAEGVTAGLLVIVVFLVGMLISNSVITLASALGFLAASGRFIIYAAVGALTGVVSLTIGILLLLGWEDLLPPLLG